MAAFSVHLHSTAEPDGFAGARADRGVMPDQPVAVTIEDKVSGRDVELQRALELIQAIWIAH